MPRLIIRNPSDHPRQGVITADWDPERAQLSSGQFLVHNDRKAFRAQLDHNHPQDPEPATLVVLLNESVPPVGNGANANQPKLILEEVASGDLEREFPRDAPKPRVEVEKTGFRLINNRLEIWFNLGDLDGRPWFAGSMSSVQLSDGEVHRLEMLDAVNAIYGFPHDPEKRLQIDRLRLSHPASGPDFFQDVYLFDKPFQIIPESVSAGLVRATVTLKSEPFWYDYRDPILRTPHHLHCNLIRTISLYHEADYIFEHMYILGVPEPDTNNTKPVRLFFAARYFAYMVMGLHPQITHFAHIPDWLSVSYPVYPLQGYGFATNAHAGPIFNPPFDFPLPECDHNSFAWELGPSDDVHALHFFRRCSAEDLAAETGRAWYNHIFHPLKAELSL